MHGLAESTLHRKAVRVTEDGGGVSLELHLSVTRGSHVPTVGVAVQEAVAGYLERMAGLRPATIDVIVDEVQAPAAPA